MAPKALENITVLDLTKVLAGPYCGAILADFGADVIKVEPVDKGDDSRHYGPYINGVSLYYANVNRGKKSLSLNLKSEEGKTILKQLVGKADILIESFRPGVMDRLGLGYETLNKINPRLIYGAISSFGQNGPYANRPGYDIISQAMGGLMSITGQKDSPPTRSGNAIGDVLGGMNLTIGIMMALHARETSGCGQFIDIALVDGIISSLEQAWQRFFVSGELPVRHGNSYDAIAPYDSFQAKDGYLVIGCGNQKLFIALCKQILKQPQLINDKRFIDVPNRVNNNEVFKQIVEVWLKDRTVEEAITAFNEAGIPAAPIYNLRQISEDVHFCKYREMFVEIEQPQVGKIKLNSTAVKLSDTKAQVQGAAPVLGEHSSQILSQLGYNDLQIEDFRRKNII